VEWAADEAGQMRNNILKYPGEEVHFDYSSWQPSQESEEEEFGQ
jgi:hypothetical protein